MGRLPLWPVSWQGGVSPNPKDKSWPSACDPLWLSRRIPPCSRGRKSWRGVVVWSLGSHARCGFSRSLQFFRLPKTAPTVFPQVDGLLLFLSPRENRTERRKPHRACFRQGSIAPFLSLPRNLRKRAALSFCRIHDPSLGLGEIPLWLVSWQGGDAPLARWPRPLAMCEGSLSHVALRATSNNLRCYVSWGGSCAFAALGMEGPTT